MAGPNGRCWLRAWLGAALIGVANGVAREATYAKRVDERTAHQLSGLTAVTAFGRERVLYVRPCNRLLSVTQLVAWVCLSLALLLFSLNSKVFWWNYVLLIPALLQSFVLLPLWHHGPYGLDAMRTKIVYAWAHLFAFRDRVLGRRVAWSPTGGASAARAEARIRRLKLLLVGWPLTVLAGTVAGSVAHMDSALDFNYWPPLLAAAAFGLAAAAVLVPLDATTYRTALEIESAGARPGRPLRAGGLVPGVAAPLVFRSTTPDEAKPLSPPEAH